MPGNLAPLQGPTNDHLGTLRRLPHATKEAGGLYGENWREDVKIHLFLDNVGSRAREYRCRDFWGLIDGIAVWTQQLW
jgi:hypothetical protein